MQPDWQRQIYRASRLDEYRAYVRGETFMGDEYTTAEFVRRLTTREETPQMSAGTAIHKVIEEFGFGDLPIWKECNGWHIVFDLDAEVAMPEAREVELYREHNGVPLFGKVDAIDATTVHDTKTTANIDIDRYMDSYQWRAYLWMSGRRRFVYDILRVKMDEAAKVVTVLEYVPLPVHAYPGMARDIERLLEGFDACVRALGIDALAADMAKAA